MSLPRKRRSHPGLRNPGRTFWIGLALSLLVHAFWLARGHFPGARLDAPPLTARLEAEILDAPPPPQTPRETAAPPRQAAAAPAPQTAAAAPTSLAEPAAVPADEPPPALPEPPPLPAQAPPPAAAQPTALLTGAAERIRGLPAEIEIVYELKGMLSGRQTHRWKTSGEHYTLEAVTQATGLASLFIGGRLIQQSSGRIGELGLMPERYEMRRPNGKTEVIEFDYRDNLIRTTRNDPKRGARSLELPLLPGAQDPLSAIYQLAMAARDGKDGLIVAAGAKRVQGYPYHMLGAETLQTPLGETNTLHVMRAGESGKGDTHLWLAIDHHALPVKMTYVDDDGTEWVSVATSIKSR